MHWLKRCNAGRIRAALDVTDPEPLPDGHPLWSCPNLLLTPHIGGSSPQFAPRSLRIAAAELRRYMAGEPLQNVVQQGSSSLLPARAANRPVPLRLV
jgi:phosphoglycerate dehydrogenase-like enzyme